MANVHAGLDVTLSADASQLKTELDVTTSALLKSQQALVAAKVALQDYQKRMDEKHGESMLGGFREGLGEIGKTALGVFGGGALLGGIEGVAQFGEQIIGHVAQIGEMSDALGVSTDKFQQLRYAASQSGTDIEHVGKAVKNLQNILGSDDATEKQVSAFNKLKLSWEELKYASPDEQINKVMEALGRMPAGSERSAIASELMGKAGVSMLPMAGEYEELMENALKAGVVVSEANVKAAKALEDSLQAMKIKLEAWTLNSFTGAQSWWTKELVNDQEIGDIKTKFPELETDKVQDLIELKHQLGTGETAFSSNIPDKINNENDAEALKKSLSIEREIFDEMKMKNHFFDKGMNFDAIKNAGITDSNGKVIEKYIPLVNDIILGWINKEKKGLDEKEKKVNESIEKFASIKAEKQRTQEKEDLKMDKAFEHEALRRDTEIAKEDAEIEKIMAKEVKYRAEILQLEKEIANVKKYAQADIKDEEKENLDHIERRNAEEKDKLAEHNKEKKAARDLEDANLIKQRIDAQMGVIADLDKKIMAGGLNGIGGTNILQENDPQRHIRRKQLEVDESIARKVEAEREGRKVHYTFEEKKRINEVLEVEKEAQADINKLTDKKRLRKEQDAKDDKNLNKQKIEDARVDKQKEKELNKKWDRTQDKIKEYQEKIQKLNNDRLQQENKTPDSKTLESIDKHLDRLEANLKIEG